MPPSVVSLNSDISGVNPKPLSPEPLESPKPLRACPIYAKPLGPQLKPHTLQPSVSYEEAQAAEHQRAQQIAEVEAEAGFGFRAYRVLGAFGV